MTWTMTEEQLQKIIAESVKTAMQQGREDSASQTLTWSRSVSDNISRDKAKPNIMDRVTLAEKGTTSPSPRLSDGQSRDGDLSQGLRNRLTISQLEKDNRGEGSPERSEFMEQDKMQALLASLAHSTSTTGNKGIQIPVGYYGGYDHRTGLQDSITARDYYDGLKNYIEVFNRKNAALTKGARDKAVMAQIVESWEKSRQSEVAKKPNSGMFKLPIQNFFGAMRITQGLTEVQDLDPKEFLSIFEENYLLTESKADIAVKEYQTTKQLQGQTMGKYYLAFCEAQTNLNKVLPNSQYSSDKAHINQFIKGLRDDTARMQLRGNNFQTKQQLYNYCMELMKSEPEKEEAQPVYQEERRPYQQETGGRTKYNEHEAHQSPYRGKPTTSTNTFGVFAFRCTRAMRGETVCTRCGNDNHDRRECKMVENSEEAMRARQANKHDFKAGYDQRDERTYVQEYHEIQDENKLRTGNSKRHGDPGLNEGPQTKTQRQEMVDRHHRLSAPGASGFTTGANRVRMNYTTDQTKNG